jgi:TPP-dependent pyruvate/acetoin dehydrogenase alpha subunit
VMNYSPLADDRLLELYASMVRIRKFELKVNEMFLRGFVPGTIHLYHGEEAVAVGAICQLRTADRILSNHRPHGHALAKGVDPGALMAEILGRATGCSRGKGGSMHIADIEKGVMPSIPIIGAGIPIAVGVAWAFRHHGTDNVALSFFGDGTVNIGAFHEGLNLAAIWKLPVVFVCENNLYAVSTSIREVCLLERLSERAAAYGMPGITVDGNDVEQVHAAVAAAVARARGGGGPGLIECLTYRLGGHSRTDPGQYRPQAEVEHWRGRDPLDLCRRALIGRDAAMEKKCAQVEAREEEAIRVAAQFALDSPEPEAETALEDVFA